MPRRRKFARNRIYGQMRKRKPPAYVSKEWAKSKKGAKSQSSQILSLQRQLNNVKLAVRHNTIWSQYQYKPSLLSHVPTTAPEPIVYHLIGPAPVSGEHDGWRRIFNSNEQVDNNLKWDMRSIGIEYCYELGNAQTADTPITFTTFICSLRPNTAMQTLNQTNYLTGADLVEGEHYVKNSMGAVQGSGMVFLNKSIFKIHYVNRGTIGADTNFTSDVKTTTLADNRHRRYVKIPWRKLLKSDGAGTENTWKELTYQTIQATDQLFFMIFPNNYGDQIFDVSLNAVATGRTTQ